jgi:hypothetical protein
MTIGTTAITAQTHLLFSADNTYDIGATGATRPRVVWVGTAVGVGSLSISGTSIQFGDNNAYFGWSDTFLTRRGAANWRFGAADAASPVAQTISVQSATGTNVAGVNTTFTASQGTGSGAGGNIIFQVAPAGAGATVQNTLADALVIYGASRTVAVGRAFTVAGLPAAGTQGRRAWVTDATAPTFLGALTGGGAVVCPVFDNGSAWVAG